jgi:hypothetical protein
MIVCHEEVMIVWWRNRGFILRYCWETFHPLKLVFGFWVSLFESVRCFLMKTIAWDLWCYRCSWLCHDHQSSRSACRNRQWRSRIIKFWIADDRNLFFSNSRITREKRWVQMIIFIVLIRAVYGLGEIVDDNRERLKWVLRVRIFNENSRSNLWNLRSQSRMIQLKSSLCSAEKRSCFDCINLLWNESEKSTLR